MIYSTQQLLKQRRNPKRKVRDVWMNGMELKGNEKYIKEEDLYEFESTVCPL